MSRKIKTRKIKTRKINMIKGVKKKYTKRGVINIVKQEMNTNTGFEEDLKEAIKTGGKYAIRRLVMMAISSGSDVVTGAVTDVVIDEVVSYFSDN